MTIYGSTCYTVAVVVKHVHFLPSLFPTTYFPLFPHTMFQTMPMMTVPYQRIHYPYLQAAPAQFYTPVVPPPLVIRDEDINTIKVLSDPNVVTSSGEDYPITKSGCPGATKPGSNPISGRRLSCHQIGVPLNRGPLKQGPTTTTRVQSRARTLFTFPHKCSVGRRPHSLRYRHNSLRSIGSLLDCALPGDCSLVTERSICAQILVFEAFFHVTLSTISDTTIMSADVQCLSLSLSISISISLSLSMQMLGGYHIPDVSISLSISITLGVCVHIPLLQCPSLSLYLSLSLYANAGGGDITSRMCPSLSLSIYLYHGYTFKFIQYLDREEYSLVERNVMTHNTWHYLGTVCNSAGQNRNIQDFFTASGEDMRKIQQKLNAKMHPGHHINNHSHPCMKSHRNNATIPGDGCTITSIARREGGSFAVSKRLSALHKTCYVTKVVKLLLTLLELSVEVC
eukprot:sb/3464575/